MIDNPNPNDFYTEELMAQRQTAIIPYKERLLKKLDDLTNKIKSEEPFPHGNMDFETLSDIGDAVDEILSAWYY